LVKPFFIAFIAVTEQTEFRFQSQKIPVGSLSISSTSFSGVTLLWPAGHWCRLFFRSNQYSVQECSWG